MRALPALLALLLPALLALPPAARADAPPSEDEQMLRAVAKNLLDHARLIQERSSLETVKDLKQPPPWEGAVTVQYLAEPRVDHDCKTIKSGCQIAAALLCGEDGKKGSSAFLIAGQDALHFAKEGGKTSVDRLAFILAHEIGHVRLEHRWQRDLKYDQLYDTWWQAKGADLYKWRTEREQTRYQRVGGKLQKSDKAQIESDVQDFLAENFEQDYADQLSEFSRRKEDEADDYGYRLARAAGYSPEKMAGAFMQWEFDRFLTRGQGACEQPGPIIETGGTSHSTHRERDARIFEKFYLKGGDVQ